MCGTTRPSWSGCCPSGRHSAKHKLNLGLDLQGGIHLVMRVDVDTALKRKVQTRGEQVKAFAKEKGLGAHRRRRQPRRPSGEPRRSRMPDAKKAPSARLRTTSGTCTRWPPRRGHGHLAFRDQYIKQARTDAVDQAVKTIRNRVDQLGVAEPEIAKRGCDGISVELPGMKDPEKAKALLGTTAQLEFKIVDDENADGAKVFDGVTLPVGATGAICAAAVANKSDRAELRAVPYIRAGPEGPGEADGEASPGGRRAWPGED